MVKNPFLLFIFFNSLPALLEQNPQMLKKFNRFDLYTVFIQGWIKREVEHCLTKDDKILLGYKDDKTLMQDCLQLAIDLALSMFANKYTFLQFDTLNETPDLLAQKVAKNVLEHKKILAAAAKKLCEILPLAIVSSKNKWMHKSLYEYLLASAWLQLGINNLTDKENVIYYLKHRPIQEEPEAIYFLQEMLTNSTHQSALEKLVIASKELVLRSRDDADLAPISANAATLMNALNVSFAYEDFHGIKIPGADLNKSILDHTIFDDADLTNVNFKNAFLFHTRLRKAELEGLYLQPVYITKLALEKKMPLNLVSHLTDNGRF